jgi:hypothetical protein
MDYRNEPMLIKNLVSDLNSGTIDLCPAFQRGHAWNIKMRKKLLKNILEKKPIPAIFLYKEPAEAKFTYNILDGKQRIESLILFIGNKQNATIQIPKWDQYFSSEPAIKHDVNFKVRLNGKKKDENILSLDDDVVRDFREYSIPVVSITMDDYTTFEDIISLFVDINQQGVRVKRMQIIRALNAKDKLLDQVLKLISGREKTRGGKDIIYKPKRSSSFFYVLKNLSIVEKAKSGQAKIEIMWEKLLEIAIFAQNGEHKKPSEILKTYLNVASGTIKNRKVNETELILLVTMFNFFEATYKKHDLNKSKLAADVTHFYTMATTIYNNKLIDLYGKTLLGEKINFISNLFDKPAKINKAIQDKFEEYLLTYAKRTTDIKNRKERERLFKELLSMSLTN